MARASSIPFAPGQQLHTPSMRIHIDETNAYGQATRVTFHFNVPLEHPPLRWLKWTPTGITAFTPPPQGASLHVPAVAIPP